VTQIGDFTPRLKWGKISSLIKNSKLCYKHFFRLNKQIGLKNPRNNFSVTEIFDTFLWTQINQSHRDATFRFKERSLWPRSSIVNVVWVAASVICPETLKRRRLLRRKRKKFPAFRCYAKVIRILKLLGTWFCKVKFESPNFDWFQDHLYALTFHSY